MTILPKQQQTMPAAGPAPAAAKQKRRRRWLQYVALLLFILFVAGGNLTAILAAVQGKKHLRMQQDRRQADDSSNTAGALRPHQSRLAASPAKAAAGLQLPRVFVGVLSSAANYKSREVIRHTWGADPLLTASGSRVMFFCLRPSSNEAFRELRREEAAARDIFITSEVSEAYYNITYAVLDIFKVAAALSDGFSYVVKTDDDIYVRPRLLLAALQGMPAERLYAGWPMWPGSVLRHGSWHAVSYDNWPSDTPVRCGYRAGYALSMDLAQQVAAGGAHMTMAPDNLLLIEDTAVGIWIDHISKEQGLPIVYNDSFVLGGPELGCNATTMFFHVTQQPEWAGLLCMHEAGGQCCTEELCGDCLAQHTKQLVDAEAPAAAAAAAAADSSGTNSNRHSTAASASRSSATPSTLGPTTNAPMMPQPPFALGCFPSVYRMQQLGCPVIDCSLDPACTMTNTSCCAYVNAQVLDFLDRFLTANCLQDEFMLVYGTVLGSVRQDTIIPYTEDVDVALTPLAVQFLELNSTKEALWRHGYTFWYHHPRGIWKVCPHLHHPSPQFQDLMVTGVDVDVYEGHTGRLMAGYADGWLMWRVPDTTQRCSEPPNAADGTTAALATPWDGDRAALAAGVDVCGKQAELAAAAAAASTLPQGGSGQPQAAPKGGTSGDGGLQQKFCVSESDVPHVLQLGMRAARIDDKAFPMPDNYAEVMAATYGPDWEHPTTGYHGKSLFPRDEASLKEALLEKLSTTAWGDTPWQERKEACGL